MRQSSQKGARKYDIGHEWQTIPGTMLLRTETWRDEIPGLGYRELRTLRVRRSNSDIAQVGPTVPEMAMLYR